MAASADELATILRNAGLTVSTAYLRSGESGSFTPRALILHHDAAGLSYTDAWGGVDDTSIAQDMATPGTNGAQFWVGRTGTWYILSDGLKWHAGTGGGYGNIPANQGNQYAYGVETDYGPVRPGWSGPTVTSAGYTWPRWDSAHLGSIVTGTTALAKALRLTTACGHKEYAPTRKIDPANFDLATWRTTVLAGVVPPGQNTQPPPVPSGGGSTQNGWPYPPQTRLYTVPGSTAVVELTADQTAAYVLAWCCAQWNKRIEPIDPAQIGGYDPNRQTNGLGAGSTSNHKSATAVDINAGKHPQGTSTFSDQMVASVHWIIAQTQASVRWGGDWTGGTKDEMHLELCTTDQARLRQAAKDMRTATPEWPTVSSVVGSGGAAVPGSTSGGSAIDLTVPTLTTWPAMPLTPIGNKNPVSVKGRLSAIRLGGSGFITEVAALVSTASMSYAADAVGALSITLNDDRGAPLQRSKYISVGVPLSFGDQRMDIRTIDTADGPTGPVIRIEARSRTLFRLKTGNQVGAGSWGTVDTNSWVHERAREVGARSVVQPDLYELVITRAEGEATWSVLQKVARIHQAWCFEYEQTIFFGQPTWFASRKNVRGWQLRWHGLDRYTDGLAAMPSYSATADATTPDAVESLKVSLMSEDAFRWRPGDLINYQGDVGDAAGWWIITAVDLDLGGAGRVTAQVQAQRVINPENNEQLLDPAQAQGQTNQGGVGAVTPGAANTTTPGQGQP